MKNKSAEFGCVIIRVLSVIAIGKSIHFIHLRNKKSNRHPDRTERTKAETEPNQNCKIIN
jgi:hypothetical protein